MKLHVVIALTVSSFTTVLQSLPRQHHPHCYTHERCHTEYMVNNKMDHEPYGIQNEGCQTFYDEVCETFYVRVCGKHGYHHHHHECHSVPDVRCLEVPRVECAMPIPTPRQVCRPYHECEHHHHGLFRRLFYR